MSDWLVDTHALLWFLADDPKLSAAARATMESGESTLLVSAVTVWEITIKAALGKLEAPAGLLDSLPEQGFDELPVSGRHAWRVGSLPLGAHQDPFDRLLVAHAIEEGLAIISVDAQLDQYGVTRHW